MIAKIHATSNASRELKTATARCRGVGSLGLPVVLLGFARLGRPAGFLPGLEATQHMGDRLEPHVLRRLGGERRAQTAGAEEHELLVLAEDRLEVGALRVDPELQHAARHAEGAGHFAVALQLARIAQVDQHHVRASRQLDRVGSLDLLDLPLGGLYHRLHALGDLLWHRCPPIQGCTTGPADGHAHMALLLRQTPFHRHVLMAVWPANLVASALCLRAFPSSQRFSSWPPARRCRGTRRRPWTTRSPSPAPARRSKAAMSTRGAATR